MRFSQPIVLLALVLVGPGVVVPAVESASCERSVSDRVPPRIDPLVMKNGAVVEPNDEAYEMADVIGCCGVETCVDDQTIYTPQTIGKMPQMNQEQTLQVLREAKESWDGGSGLWPQMSITDRIAAIQNFVQQLNSQRSNIINLLMWEVGKNQNDAAAEFDRTMKFIQALIAQIQQNPSHWQTIGSVRAYVRRAAIGIILALGPYNYPLNETYATLIPALLMGNIVIMKIPTIGGLSHLLTMDAFSKALPPGTIHFVSGGGRATMPPLMQSGDIDGLAFIGGSRAADDLIRKHPHPHRLKLFLQLEAKNMAVFLPSVFKAEHTALLDTSLDESIVGSLSFNGQRCTALKIFFVPRDSAATFVDKFVQKVDSLFVGLPWETDENGGVPTVTPLPNMKRVNYMKELIEDAVSKGAKIMNKDGGKIIGGSDSTLMVPAVLYPVTKECKLYHEEQFGPVIPIVPYDDIDSCIEYGRDGEYGQQVAIFTSDENSDTASGLLDKFSTVFGKININNQCGRSPDSLPFSGRRSSALGVMSVSEALREFSVPTVVSYKNRGTNAEIVGKIEASSTFMKNL